MGRFAAAEWLRLGGKGADAPDGQLGRHPCSVKCKVDASETSKFTFVQDKKLGARPEGLPAGRKAGGHPGGPAAVESVHLRPTAANNIGGWAPPSAKAPNKRRRGPRRPTSRYVVRPALRQAPGHTANAQMGETNVGAAEIVVGVARARSYFSASGWSALASSPLGKRVNGGGHASPSACLRNYSPWQALVGWRAKMHTAILVQCMPLSCRSTWLRKAHMTSRNAA